MDKKQNIVTVLVSLLMVALLLPIGLNLFADRNEQIIRTTVHPNIYLMDITELSISSEVTEYDFDLPLTIIAFSASASGNVTLGGSEYYTNGTSQFTLIDPITGPFTIIFENETNTQYCMIQLIATLGNGSLFNITTNDVDGVMLYFEVNQTQLNLTVYDVNSSFGSSFLVESDRIYPEGNTIYFGIEHTVYPHYPNVYSPAFCSRNYFMIIIGNPVNGTIRIDAYTQSVQSAIPENLEPIWNMIPIFIVIGIVMYFAPEIKKRWR